MSTSFSALMPPRAEVLDSILTLSANQFDRLCLRVMNRMFLSSWARNDEGFHQEIEDAAAFYTQTQFREDPAAFHAPPGPHTPRIEELGRLGDGRLLEVTFDSGFVPRYPAFLKEFELYEENRQIHLWHLAHRTPRPTVLYVHGWATGFPGFEMRFIPLLSLYAQGYDVVLFTLPYHGVRTPKQAMFGGQLFPCPKIDRTNEGFAHAIHDLRVTLNYLEQRGNGPVGVMGVSMGSYVSALLAGLGAPLEFLMMMIPLADLPELMWCHGEGNPDKERAERMGITRERLQTLYSVHSPLRLEPRLPPERVLIVAGRGDAICPRSQTEMLWRHFGEPRVHWFPGSHVAHFGRAQLAKTLGDFAARWFNPCS